VAQQAVTTTHICLEVRNTVRLKDKKIAVFVADLFEDIEYWYPYYRMQEAGAEVVSVGPSTGPFEGKRGTTATPDSTIDNVKAIEFDAVIIPGGYAPDHMRRSRQMIEFVREMNKQRKPVAAICHGPWMMASAGIVANRSVTGFMSIADDLRNAGADWKQNVPVVKYENLITSRNPDDLPAFCTAIIEAINYSN
jgi:protease I